jgi:hypothetical protein
VADGVFVGRVPTARELRASPFAALVDVTAEFDVDAAGRRYALVPMLDLATPAPDELKRAAQAIERLRGEGPLLVCCAPRPLAQRVRGRRVADRDRPLRATPAPPSRPSARGRAWRCSAERHVAALAGNGRVNSEAVDARSGGCCARSRAR